MFLPCVTAYFQRLVVYPTARVQQVLKLAALGLGWEKPELEGLHGRIITQFSKESNVT